MKKLAHFIFSKKITIGQTIEHGLVRYHRYVDSLHAQDLTNAGKKGKLVNQFSISSYNDDHDQFDFIFSKITENTSFDHALTQAKFFINHEKNLDLRLYESQAKGIHVNPSEASGFKKIKIENAHFTLTADSQTFSIREKHPGTEAIIPTVYGKQRTAIKLFYNWVLENETKIQTMTFEQLKLALHHSNIDTHTYNTMD